jgi:hypothetical protein
MAADYDSPWKEALDIYFESFLVLLFPEIAAQIDWSRGWESLDKEFQQLVHESEVGRRYVDKLVRVWTTCGAETWVLIHVEVQTDQDPEFPRRMFVYHYRIFDRYNKPVASLAVLADDDALWRPDLFREIVFGCESTLRFPIAKLRDFANKVEELEASSNPFAKVVLAHLKAMQTKDNPADRRAWKIRLVRNLYDRGFSANDVRELFRVIDWLMELPQPLRDVFWEEVDRIQQEKQMPFISTPERYGHVRGLRQGIKVALKLRFGEDGLKLMPEVGELHDEDQLEAILESIETAASPQDLRRIWLAEEKK